MHPAEPPHDALDRAFRFLPVIGIEFLPLGFLLIAQDVPFLRKPVGSAVIWCEFQLMRLWHRRRNRRERAWTLRRDSRGKGC